MKNWFENYLSDEILIKNELSVKELVQEALINQQGRLSANGALVVNTGKHTGRSADDKYVVAGPIADAEIDWSNNIRKLSRSDFQSIREEILNDFEQNGPVYTIEKSVGAHPDYSLGVRLITTNPVHVLFSHHIFREKSSKNKLGTFTVLHHPKPELEIKDFGLKSSTAIIIDFENREIIISGTSYAGEIKKSIFSVLNVLLPDLDVLPMHTGANVTKDGKVSLFFGLSGTGKTTLSTDEGTYLIGDDEHGLYPSGVFNFEGGCYAKTLGLTVKSEPQIFQAIKTPGTLLENVVIDESTREPIFTDSSITENGRATYPLSSIPSALQEGIAGPPSNIFFLTADAFGVLPAVSKLSNDQALFYFLSGYTAKLAGTEVGLKKVTATFSHCFGAPFMMRKPEVYAQLLMNYIKRLNINVWLINTGWYGGAYGKGKRYELSLTRNIIRGIQKGELDHVYCSTEPYFSLSIPEEVPGVEDSRLLPYKSWSNLNEYNQSAQMLKSLFEKNFEKYNLDLKTINNQRQTYSPDQAHGHN